MSILYGNRLRKGSVLLDIDSIIDIPLGFVLMLQETIKSPGVFTSLKMENIIDYYFLDKSLKELKQLRVNETGFDIVGGCFKERNSTVDSFVKVLFESNRNSIVKNAPFTVLNRMVYSYNTYGGGLIDTHIRCNDDIEVEKVKSNKLLRSSTSIFVKDPKDIDLSKYDRIIVGDVHSLDQYDFSKNPAISIAILNYSDNLQVAGNDVIILPEYISKYGRNTTLRVIDSYTDI